MRFIGLVKLAVLSVTIGVRAAVAQPQADAGWRRYADDSGTKVDFPSLLFSKSAGKAQRGTGERFVRSDGRAEMSIYVFDNQEGRSPREYLKQHMTDRASSLDYIRIARRFFVTSKYAGEDILYRRCNFGPEKIHCIDLVYPADEKRAWDAPVTRMSLSLRPL